MNKHFILFTIVLYFICGCFGQSVSQYFDEKDGKSLIQTLTTSQKKDGSFLGLKNTFYAVSSFQLLKSNIPQKEKVCEFVNSASVVDTESTLYFAGITEAAGCGKALNDQQKNLLKSSLKSDSLENIYHGVSAYSLLVKSKRVSLNEEDLVSAFNTVTDLCEDDGTARGSSNDEEGSLYYGALALNSLAQLAHHVELKDAQKAKLKKILSNAVAVEGEVDGSIVEYKDEQGKVSSLKLTSLFFRGINELSQLVDKKPSFKQDDIVGISELFIQNKNPSSVEDIYFVTSGIQTVAQNNFAKPLVLSLVKNSLSVSSKSDNLVKVTLTDLFGKFATKATVFLSEAVATATKKQVIANQEIFLAENAKSLYQTNFLATKPEPGSYELNFRVVPEDKSFIPIESSSAYLKVVGSASISDIQLIVTESGDVHSLSEGTSYTINHPQPLKETVTVTEANHLFVSFKLTSGNKALSVHQAFVTLTNPKTKAFITAVAEKKNNKYLAHLNLGASVSEFHATNGSYNLEFEIGDAFVDNSFVWKAASLDVKFSANLAAPESEVAWKPKKSLEWTQRPAETRPPKVISLAFTLLVGAPLLFLLFSLLAIGANVNNFPSGGNFIYAVGFQGGIGAILFLFAVYWLFLNMIQTLTYLTILAVPTCYCAVKTLNFLSTKSSTSKTD